MASPTLGLRQRLLSTCARGRESLSHLISWNPTGRPQQTLASAVRRSGTALHSGDFTTARLFPAAAGEGRYFVTGDMQSLLRTKIPASIDHVVESALCTTLCRDGARVRTVEHLLSALEACGVDNCRIEIDGGDEVPLLDGSAKEWVEAIKQAGLCVAEDHKGHSLEKLVPALREPLYLWQRSSFLIAFPSPKIHITCGINFPKVPLIGTQWFSSLMDESTYMKEISSARTFCIYEEAEEIYRAGLIKGGSLDNAIVCSVTAGWLNPPLRFIDEPCRHKALDLVGGFFSFCTKWKSRTTSSTHNCLQGWPCTTHRLCAADVKTKASKTKASLNVSTSNIKTSSSCFQCLYQSTMEDSSIYDLVDS